MTRNATRSVDYALQKLNTKDPYYTNVELFMAFPKEEQFDALIDAMDGNTTIQTLEIGCNGLTDDEFARIAHALRDNQVIDTLDLSTNNLGAAGMKTLAGLIAHLPKLQRLYLGDNQIDDAGLETLRQAVEGHPELLTLAVHNNPCSAPTVIRMAETASALPQLTSFSVDRKNKWDPATIESINAPFEARRSKNITAVMPFSKPVQQLCAANQKKARHLLGAIASTTAKPSTMELFEVPGRMAAINAMAHLDSGFDGPSPDMRKRYGEILDSLPSLAPASPLSFEMLTRADARGYTPLDNPRNWEAQPELFTTLNEWVATQPDLAAWHSPQGLSLLDYTLIAAPDTTAQVIRLNEAGVQLRQDFLFRDGVQGAQLSPMAAWMAEEGILGSVFTSDNWLGASQQDLKRTMAALPPEIKAQISNVHSLLASLSPKKGEITR